MESLEGRLTVITQKRRRPSADVRHAATRAESTGQRHGERRLRKATAQKGAGFLPARLPVSTPISACSTVAPLENLPPFDGPLEAAERRRIGVTGINIRAAFGRES